MKKLSITSIMALFFVFCVPLASAAPGKVTNLSCWQAGTNIMCSYTPMPVIGNNPYTDLRYRIGTTLISALNFASSSQISGESAPVAGLETFISFPSPSTNQMSFGLKNCDTSCSLISNVSVVKYTVPSSKITLAWDPHPDTGVKGFLMYYGNSSGNYEFFVDVGYVNSCTLSGLTPGLTYYFAVTAYYLTPDNKKVESIFSNEVSDLL